MREDNKSISAVMAIIGFVSPNRESIRASIRDHQGAHPNYDRARLASDWADRACWLLAAEGAASALPGAIPGIGTVAQIVVETGAIGADVLYMLRCMAGMTLGVAMIYERDIDAFFNDEFIKILGMWCGTLTLARSQAKRVATKVAMAQFKRVPSEIFKRINRRVGTTIVTKYGVKRGGIAVGKLIPFGVGAVIGGGFNLATMKGFKKAAIAYFSTDDRTVVMDE